jgi:hypothetical protein
MRSQQYSRPFLSIAFKAARYTASPKFSFAGFQCFAKAIGVKAPSSSHAILRLASVAWIALLGSSTARAGMTVYDLTDVARLRLEDISFFGFLLLIATLGIRFLWNFLAKDFTRLPRLTFMKALSLTALLSLSMLLVLVMISGARELLTPGAWSRQGSHYRPNDVGNAEQRQQSIEALRSALVQYAHNHNGQFPPHDYITEIPTRSWEAPDSSGTRYIYFAGLTLDRTNSLLFCEPQNFGDERLVVFADGKIQKLKTDEIHRLMGVKAR